MLVLGSIGTMSSALTHENTPIVSNAIVENNNDLTILEPSEVKLDEEIENRNELNSIKKSDESKFSKEEWEEILKQVENNEVILVE